MDGKRILITGGNSGIGIVTARELAKRGAEVVLACRESNKTDEALKVINVDAKIPAVNLAVELDSLQSVRDLSETFLNRYDHLDVLINNAGVFPPKQKWTFDGLEMQMGVNHLSHFLLTNLLLECLKVNSPSRVVTVSSKLHSGGKIDFDSFKGYQKYNSQTAYNGSKLANVLFSVELAKRLEGTGVTSNVLHPGAVSTDITRELPWVLRKIIGMIFISPEKGALTNIMLSSDPMLADVTGKYFDQCERTECSPQADDEALRQKLWEVSAEMTGLSQ
jgi:NAD(P)-dependent dehydrogenase (short-subunit alcohol dehydrogenase family)